MNLHKAKIASISWIIIGLLLTGCQSIPKHDHKRAHVHHVVICWLKQPGHLKARKRLIDVSRHLLSIPGVVSVKAGQVLPSERKVVDNSFDVAIIISFTDIKALHTYQNNPIHQKAIKETLIPLTKRVLIYDFVEQK